ncbi:MAG: hypothetical protein KDB00_20920 [Planctomycetales bacterium]|nr:hypothetical protein [Planctomycetales bacterium]
MGEFSLKDQLFNRDRVEYLAGRFSATNGDFDAAGFVNGTMRRLNQLELKARIVHIAEQLERHLSPDFPTAAKQITKSLPPPLDPRKTDDDFGDFIFAPLGEFVVRNGLRKKHLKLSLRTLKMLTQRFSMEDAIRAFINQHTEPTIVELTKWAGDKNYHIRRLVSEGTRPMLPWSKRIAIDVTTPLPLLETLHADPTRYVTRSVANHLNDISKSHPDLVVETLTRWKSLDVQDERELRWISKHALRTLVKKGNVNALRFLGYRPNPQIQVSNFSLTAARITPGESIELSFNLTAQRDESLMVDYVIDFVKSNGTHAPKVHKLKQMDIGKGQQVKIRKSHRLHANATTYKLYPGTHHVTLQINGKPFGKQSFELVM